MSRPNGLPRRQSYEPLSLSSSSSNSSSSTLSLGKLPPPSFDRFGAGQRSVPAFEASSFHLFVGVSHPNSKLSPSHPHSNSSATRSISGPGPTAINSNSFLGGDDGGQRTPGGGVGMAIGDEVFGVKVVRESLSKEALVHSRWNGDDTKKTHATLREVDENEIESSRSATPTQNGGWPVEYEPHSSPILGNKKDKPDHPMMATKARPTMKQSGSSIDLRSSGSAKSSTFDNDMINGSSTTSSTSSFGSVRPSIPRSKSGLPGYDLPYVERTRISSTPPLSASRPAAPHVSLEPPLNATNHRDSTESQRQAAGQQLEGRIVNLTSAASVESFFKFSSDEIGYNTPSLSEDIITSGGGGKPVGENGGGVADGYSSVQGTHNGRHVETNFINTKVAHVPGIRTADPTVTDRSRSSHNGYEPYQQHSQASPDDLVHSMNHMSLTRNASQIQPFVQRQHLQNGRHETTYGIPPVSLGADWRSSPGYSASSVSQYTSTSPSSSQSRAHNSTLGVYYQQEPFIAPHEVYYGPPEGTYYGAQGVEPPTSRRESETLPLSWGMGMPTTLDYSPSSTAAASRNGSFSSPYTQVMLSQPSSYPYTLVANTPVHPATSYDLQGTMGSTNGFQPAQQHQIILGRQIRSTAEYIAPGPRHIPQSNGMSSNLNSVGLMAYNMARPYGVGYGAGYGAGETMGRALRSQLLDEFRNVRHKHWELSDIAGHIVEFSGDQLGSRFIQTKLETASPGEKDMSFQELLPNLLQLSTDVFANYVVQKFFEQGSQLQKTAMANVLEGHILELSMQMYGCRVVQKAIEFLLLDQQIHLVKELDGQVLKCARDAQANHVIQRAIERVPSNKIAFISDACHSNVPMLATHPYGCRVLQRIFEHCPPARSRPLLDELHTCSQHLIQDQYGNYVVQWVIENGDPADRSLVISSLLGSVFHLAQQKFASNVVEKCILHGSEEERKNMIQEFLGQQPDGSSTIRSMLVHPFANYVVQKIITQATGAQRERVLQETTLQLATLRNHSGAYSKHLVTIEKLLQNERMRP